MVPALLGWHPMHAPAFDATAEVARLPAHAALEAYSVLTRLPGSGLTREDVRSMLTASFPGRRLELEPGSDVVERLAEAGIGGGAVYDALVALQADAHAERLLTCDARAAETYRRLGVAFELLR